LFLNTQTDVLKLPIFPQLAPKSTAAGEPAGPAATGASDRTLVGGPCTVAPLPPITDPRAAAFNAGEIVDTSNLTRGMSRALARFQKAVAQVGGSLELKSAYRPPAYQQHLQSVWDKWKELRNNNVAACQGLRAQVHQEFERHDLLETQRPVTSSDHTRGLAFDATVVIPANARMKRRKVTLDSLARYAGLRRPDIWRDPVHFKFVGGKSTRA
jgi:hypothetical protein